MSLGSRSFVPPGRVRDELRADLDVIDAAYARIREMSTDLVGNAFRIEVAERLEAQDRVNRGMSYRMFGEIAEPPEGAEDPELPAGVRVRDILAARLRITANEVRRRMRVAARLLPRRSLTGPSTPPELPVLARAVEEGVVGEAHIFEVCKALDHLPKTVSAEDRERAEAVLVEHARRQDSAFVAEVGRVLADALNPDGIFDEHDRADRRGLVLGPQGPDGMSRLSGWLTPSARAFFEAVVAAVRPGHRVPDSDAPVVDGLGDGRSKSQRAHDAFAWALDTAISSGKLGLHRGLPVTVIATTTVADLEQAARAVADPAEPMPAPARTGGRSWLPMRDLIRMASRAVHYLLVFEGHSDRPLYLGRAKRLATADQRIACYGRDHGCTHCAEPGYHSEVHHAVDAAAGGPTDIDNLFFACGPSNRAVAEGIYRTEVTESGRLAWTDGTGAPRVNKFHHPEELLEEKPDEQVFDDREDP